MQSFSQSSSVIKSGAPHFKSLMRQHRSSNYTFEKILFEYLDNNCRRAQECTIKTIVDDNGRLRYITVSDNFEGGFEDIHKEGSENPFNMGHIRLGQYNDNDSGMYGVGMKSASIAGGNKLSVVTKVGNKYYEVELDFMKMEQEPDVNLSYNPSLIEITEARYKDKHPYNQGSSVTLSEIREQIFGKITQEEMTEHIRSKVAFHYAEFLRNGIMNINVNGVVIKPSYDIFEDPKVKPFTITKKIHILKNISLPNEIFVERIGKRTTWEKYDNTEKKNNSSTWDELNSLIKKGYIHCSSISQDEKSAIIVTTCFAFYSDHPSNLLKDVVIMELNDRVMGDMPIVRNVNGSMNYTGHKVQIVSKAIAKELGLTYNREFHNSVDNDLMNALKSAIKDNRSCYNADTSTTLNKKLFDEAVQLKIVDPNTCHTLKLPQSYRDKREKKDSQSNPSPKMEIKQTVAVQPKVGGGAVSQSKSSPNVEVKSTTTSTTDQVSSSTVTPSSTVVSPTPIPQNITEVQVSAQPKEPICSVIQENKSESKLETKPIVVPVITPVGPSKHTTVSKKQGISMLQKWKTSNIHVDQLDIILSEIICRYLENCARGQVEEDVIPFVNKYEMVLHLINKRYPIETDDMLVGSELYKKFIRLSI